MLSDQKFLSIAIILGSLAISASIFFFAMTFANQPHPGRYVIATLGSANLILDTESGKMMQPK